MCAYEWLWLWTWILPLNHRYASNPVAISGWAWDKSQPNTPNMVEFYTGRTVWGSALANKYRPDLKSAGKGNGAHAYSFEVPKALKDGQSRLIRARVLNSSYELKWSGKVLTCPSATRLSVETASALSVMILGNHVLSDHLTVEVRGASGHPLHLQLREVRGRIISERSVENAGVIERLSLPVKSSSAGLLLLQVTSGQQNLTLKVAKPWFWPLSSHFNQLLKISSNYNNSGLLSINNVNCGPFVILLRLTKHVRPYGWIYTHFGKTKNGPAVKKPSNLPTEKDLLLATKTVCLECLPY